MLANVAHSPAWKSQGYVCLACRRQRTVSNRRRHERRFNSTETDQSPQPSYSWFDALNDISDDYSSSKSIKKPSRSVSVKTSSAKAPFNKPPTTPISANKESSHEHSDGKIDGLRSRLDEEILGNGQDRAKTQRLDELINGMKSLASAEGKRTHNVATKRSRVGRAGLSNKESLEIPKPPYTPQKSLDLEASTEQDKVLTGEEPTKQFSEEPDAKSQIIADLVNQANRRAEQREQDSGTENKGDSTRDGAPVLESSTSPSRPSSFHITRHRGPSKLEPRPWPAPSYSRDVHGAKVQSKIHQRSLRNAQMIADVDIHLNHGNTMASLEEIASQAAMFERPMTLVERWLMNQKRTLPWGVSRAPETLIRRTSSSSKDISSTKPSDPENVAAAARAKAKLTPNLKQASALGDGIATLTKDNKTTSPELFESIGKILDDMKKRAGSDQAITAPDEASLGTQAQDQTEEELSKGNEMAPQSSSLLAAVSPEQGAKAAATEHVPLSGVLSVIPEETPELVHGEANSPKTSPETEDASDSAPTDSPVKQEAIVVTESLAEEHTLAPEELTVSSAAQDGAIVAESSVTEYAPFLEVASAPSQGLAWQGRGPDKEPPSVQSEESMQPDVEQTEESAPARTRLGSLWEERGHVAATVQSKKATSNGLHSSTSVTSSSGPQDHSRPWHPFVRSFHSRSLKAAMLGEAAQEEPARDKSADEREDTPSNVEIKSIETSSLEVEPLDIPQPPVPYLEYGLDRVLFNPGVYQLQDPASRVYNFDPYLQKIMPVVEFDFDALKEYKTSSQDQALAELAKAQGKKYIGSTSSMTSSLAHFHFLLSNWRPINLSMLTHGFVGKGTSANFTEISRAPSAVFLRWKDGTYAIDADKQYDGANVLMLLGKSMELLLTLPTSEYEKYRKSDPRQVSEESKTAPESYQYTTMRDFLMRSQLDAYDPRLPGNGTFDLKTRAVVSVRMQSQDFEPMTGYEIFGLHGKWGSYEREYFDMIRATMLKYMLQARMGRMNGIFIAYHNVKRIFGFQYVPMSDMDLALHGQSDTCLGDQEFKASLEIMNELFNKATEKFPGQSLRFHFETPSQRNDGSPTALHVFAEPMSEDDIDTIQNSQKAKVQEFERNIMGKSGESADAPQPTKAKATDTGASGTPGLSSTNSDADVSFLGSISTTKADDKLKPLFYATVIVQSKVNEQTVPNDRPTNLKREDKWEIDYIIKEYDITEHEWALYEDCRARRKYALTERDDEDGADPESDGEPRKESSFIRYLKQMAADGRAFRKKIDKLEADREVVRVDQPLPKEREKINGVDDYMAWMYGSK